MRRATGRTISHRLAEPRAVRPGSRLWCRAHSFLQWLVAPRRRVLSRASMSPSMPSGRHLVRSIPSSKSSCNRGARVGLAQTAVVGIAVLVAVGEGEETHRALDVTCCGELVESSSTRLKTPVMMAATMTLAALIVAAGWSLRGFKDLSTARIPRLLLNPCPAGTLVIRS